MYILYDIGGTKMRFAASVDLKNIEDSKIVPTPQDFFEGIKLFSQTSKELAKGQKIHAVAGGIAGPLDKNKTKMVKAPNISQWANQPLKASLEKALDAEVFLENDAALVGLGESVFGAGKGHKIAVYITMSTGVGGSRFVEGKIDSNSLGFEPGHQTINFDGPPCTGCGGIGHLEGYVSGRALQEKYNKSAEEIDDPAIWDQEANLLAFGLNNIIVHWSPDAIILGGSLMKKIDIEKVKEYTKKTVTIFPQIPQILLAKLGDLGGLYGAMAYLKTIL